MYGEAVWCFKLAKGFVVMAPEPFAMLVDSPSLTLLPSA